MGTRFQVLFHSPPGVLFTFPSRYWFTIGHWLVFSLARWSSQIQTGFLVSRPTQDPDRLSLDFAYGAVTLSGASSQMLLLSAEMPRFSPTTPLDKSSGLGSFLFARRYLGNRISFSSCSYLDVSVHCVFLLQAMYSLKDDMSPCRVPPFGYLRITAYLRLPEDFRGSSRPSSASSAQAFTVRPSSLDLFKF